MVFIHLGDVELDMLLSACVAHPKAYVRQKSNMLLSSHRGQSVNNIAQSFGVGVRHVYRLFKAWNARGLLGLYISKGRGAKSVVAWNSVEMEKELEACVGLHPQKLTKVAADLSEKTGKKVSKRMVQRALKKKDIVGNDSERA
jgi:transposase